MSKHQFPRFATALSVLLLLATAACGRKAATQAATGRFVEITIPAPSLEGNLLGDPTEQPASIYLPPSYDSSPNKRYPVIYLVHGFTGSNRTWTIDIEPDIGYGYNIQPVLDALIASGKIQEMIVVAPNSQNSYKNTRTLNSVVAGNWEDYIVQDVVNYVDGNYRTLARAISRGIAGHSDGGYSAVYVGMRHSEVFSAVYALAPSDLAPFPFEDPNELDPQWEQAFKRLVKLASIEQLPSTTGKSEEDVLLNVAFADAFAFSVNPSRPPLYADYLFEERDGKLVRNEVAFEKRKAYTPTLLIDENKQNLLSLRGIFLDCGQYDDNQVGMAQFSKALADRGIPHTFEIYAGGDHLNKIKERLEKRVFPYFSNLLDFSQQ